jgi:hypothetical protein
MVGAYGKWPQRGPGGPLFSAVCRRAGAGDPMMCGRTLWAVTVQPSVRRSGIYALVLVVAFVVQLALRSHGMRALGYAMSLAAVAGVLIHAFIKSGRDTTPAKNWAESWRPRHLLMIALSLVLGFSAVLVPDAGDSAWVLLPILLACVPLLFTPLGKNHAETSHGRD